jgi:ABC-type lipoprotein release transport system permease subunit
MTLLHANIRLHDVVWLDARAFAGGLLVVMATALLAACQPARRAMGINPTEALRAEA